MGNRMTWILEHVDDPEEDISRLHETNEMFDMDNNTATADS